jgi:hypothetical protein
MFAMDGIKQLQNIVHLLAEKYQLEIPVKVVPTMFDTHTRFAHTILREIGEQLQVGLSNVQIRHTVRVREAAYMGQPVSQYAPDSTAAKDYRRLADEILATFEKPFVTRLDHHSETSIHAEEHEETAMGQASAKSRRQMVVLTFNDIDCRRLQLAGDFNNWVPDRDIETRNVNGHWQKVFTAEPGVYEYRLIIDGKWQHDPTNPAEIPNELGGINSLLQVPVHH